MDLAFVEKLAKDNNGVNYLLVRQDMFDRTVDAKGMKTKGSKETANFFFKIDYKKESTKKIWVDQSTEYVGDFIKFCVAEGIHVYSTMTETKATFAERTIRSLENNFYRYMEDYGYKYIRKLSHFVKILNSRQTST